jgi:predicted RNA-binding Zn ribbon-like protein
MFVDSGFEFVGGDLALDFVNTADRPKGGSVVEQERLVSPEALIGWARAAEIATEADAHRWHKDGLKSLLDEARQLREAIFRIFYDHALRVRPKASDLELLNRWLRDAAKNSEVVERGDGFGKEWTNPADPARILWQVAESAGRLLTSKALEQVKSCSSDICRWLFLDTSKNHTRRWCEMRVCGNRAKARRYLQKHS